MTDRPAADISLTEARDLLSTAAALGAEIAAPAGVIVFAGRLTNGRRGLLEDGMALIGVFSSAAEALRAMANVLLEQYPFPVTPSEFADGFDANAWCANATDLEIIDAFGVNASVVAMQVRAGLPDRESPRAS